MNLPAIDTHSHLSSTHGDVSLHRWELSARRTRWRPRV